MNIRRNQNKIKVLPDCKILITLFFVSMGVIHVFGQDYPHQIPNYSFIQHEHNKIQFPGDSSGFQDLYDQFDDVIFKGKGQINIMHMGGSHIQAGVFSSSMRSKFQTMQPGLMSYRGFIFPFRVARTNNPSNYQVRYTGSWESCKNTEKRKNCTLGVSGMSVTTFSSTSSIKVAFNDAFPKSGFTKLIVYCETDSNAFDVVANEGEEYQKEIKDGLIEFTFQNDQDSIEIQLTKRDSSDQNYFRLYGMQVVNEYPGFAYHAIGVNGASVPSYLRCDLLEKHTKTIQPDLVILSIGINDAYGTRFSSSYFKNNYRELIQKLKKANPHVKILFTTNNDSYYRRRYANKNGLLVKKAMFELAEEYDAGVWDMFSVMGGLGSVLTWQNHGLAKYDKIHFTSEGYEVIGSLLFSALVKSYEYHVQQENISSKLK